MTFHNSLTGYVNVKDLSKDVFECIMKKIGCEYSIHKEDGEEYYKFTYKRPNNFSMSYGTAAKLDFSDVTMENVDLLVEQLTETVDNLVG